MAQNGQKMTQNNSKWPKNDARIDALFPQFFLTEKAVPQTFSLLECMCASSGSTNASYKIGSTDTVSAINSTASSSISMASTSISAAITRSSTPSTVLCSIESIAVKLKTKRFKDQGQLSRSVDLVRSQ